MRSIEKRIASEIAKAKNLSAAKLGLRFDRVVIRLVEGLRAFARTSVPKEIVVLVTVTAPIRVPAKTAAMLKDRIEALLERDSSRKDYKATLHGNHVRVRLLKSLSTGAPRLIGFVHNLDSSPLVLLDAAEEWLRREGT